MKSSTTTFQPEFVSQVPDQLEEGMLYISVAFSMAIHLCPCGCRSEIVTKISPARWTLTYDGETVSLYPSVGNWTLPCRSHYWIWKNKVEWAEEWSEEQIKMGRKRDRKLMSDHLADKKIVSRKRKK